MKITKIIYNELADIPEEFIVFESDNLYDSVSGKFDSEIDFSSVEEYSNNNVSFDSSNK